jgi:hypothetical protein
MTCSAAMVPGASSYVRASSAAQLGVLFVGGRGVTPGTAADVPEETDAEAAAGCGGAGHTHRGEGTMDFIVDGGCTEAAAAAGGNDAGVSPLAAGGCGWRTRPRKSLSLSGMARRPSRRRRSVLRAARAGARRAEARAMCCR